MFEVNDILTEVPKNKFRLIIIDGQEELKICTLNEGMLFLGRRCDESECEIQLNSKYISRKHGYFFFKEDDFYYIDYPNLNGTYYNGKKICKEDKMASEPIKLNDGDVLRIDSAEMNSQDGVVIIFSIGDSEKDVWMSYSLSNMEKDVLIGRKVSERDICIPKPLVSGVHAKIVRTNQGYVIGDYKSTTGTLLNGRLLERPTVLKEKDTINICSSKLIYMNDRIIYNIPKTNLQAGVELKIENISKDVYSDKVKKKRILNDISLTISPGELVAIVGASGAGKTTFMNAICGFEKATR